MNDQILQDARNLLDLSFRTLDQLDGKKFPGGKMELNDAQTLAKKIVMHVESSLYLVQQSSPRAHACIAVLMRAAYEASLLYFYLYVDKPVEEEMRYQRWRLCGVKGRLSMKGFRDPRSPEDRAAETQLALDLEGQIEGAVIDREIWKGGELCSYSRRQWKYWKPGWSRIAEIAGFDREQFQGFYSYLCAYAHGDSWAVRQIDQAARNGDEDVVCAPFVTLAAVLLCRLLDSYPRIMSVSKVDFPANMEKRAAYYRKHLAAVPTD